MKFAFKEQRSIVEKSIERVFALLSNNPYSKPTLYLSGPMSGKPDHNFPEFNRLAKHFREQGFFVLNPAENFDGVTNLPYETHFLEDVVLLLFATHIYMLDGWETSRGAYCEYLLSRRLNHIFVYVNGLRIDPPPARETAKDIATTGFINVLEPSTDKLTKDIADAVNKRLREYAFQEKKNEHVENTITTANKQFFKNCSIEDYEVFNARLNNRVKELLVENEKLKKERDEFKKALDVALLENVGNALLEISAVSKEEEKSLAQQSIDIVNKARSAQYGNPKDDFLRTVGMLNSLGYRFETPTGEIKNLDCYDFPIIMNVVKLSRLVHTINKETFHKDSVLDIHGYMNTLEMLYK